MMRRLAPLRCAGLRSAPAAHASYSCLSASKEPD
jgi:hypothetical protein